MVRNHGEQHIRYAVHGLQRVKRLLAAIIALGIGCGYLFADITSRLNVATQDGTVTNWPYKLKVTNGSLTDNSDGTMSLTTGGSGGGGGASTLAITTGTLTTYANPAISSPTAVAVFLQTQFNETASGTTGYISINVSSITALGPSPNLSNLSGTLQASQEPAHTGDVTNSAGSLAMTAAGTQANITNLSHALTVTSSATFQSITVSSVAYLGAGLFFPNPNIVVANYTSVSTDTVIQADATGGNVQINLAPSASVDGQALILSKLDGSTNKIVVQANASELILGTTGSFTLNARGQSAILVSTGTGWAGHYDPTPASIFTYTGNAATSVAASSNVYCSWVTTTSPILATGMRVVVGTQNGNLDVGIIDFNCNRVASAGTTPVPAAAAANTVNFTSAVNLPPGQYGLCVQVSNTTATLIGGGVGLPNIFLNTETTMGIPTQLTCPGTQATKTFNLYTMVSGGQAQ